MEPRWERGWVELAHAGDVDWEPMPGDNWPVGAEVKTLSVDSTDGALTGIVRLPPGYRRGEGHHEGETEYFVLKGDLRVGETLRNGGYYQYNPPGTTQQSWVSEQGAELLFMARTGRPDFVPGSPSASDGRLEIDTRRMDWIMTPIEGPPPGMCLKPLRHLEETGERVALLSTVPQYSYPKLEFHDCIEEIYCVSGDIWLGNSGTMRAGSYLWRPPYITHGPFYSEDGCTLLLFVDEELINHFVDDPRCSREENRRSVEGATA